MTKKNEDQKPKGVLGRWRRRRASSLPPGAGVPSPTAPMPPGEPSPGVPDTARRKDDYGRPLPRIHRKAPIGGPFKPLE